jgi:hypothetical protein
MDNGGFLFAPALECGTHCCSARDRKWHLVAVSVFERPLCAAGSFAANRGGEGTPFFHRPTAPITLRRSCYRCFRRRAHEEATRDKMIGDFSKPCTISWFTTSLGVRFRLPRSATGVTIPNRTARPHVNTEYVQQSRIDPTPKMCPRFFQNSLQGPRSHRRSDERSVS